MNLRSAEAYYKFRQAVLTDDPLNQSLINVASAAAAADPWLRAVNAATAIVTAGGGGYAGLAIDVQGFALDGNGSPTTNIVRIEVGPTAGGDATTCDDAVIVGGGGGGWILCEQVYNEGGAAIVRGRSVYVYPGIGTGHFHVRFSFVLPHVTDVVVTHRHIVGVAQAIVPA